MCGLTVGARFQHHCFHNLKLRQQDARECVFLCEMKEKLNTIKELIKEGKLETAIEQLNAYIQSDTTQDDEPYYLLGNAYRKQSNWQMALNNYLEAMERNPESPAANAHQMMMDILNFYNKDMYNQ